MRHASNLDFVGLNNGTGRGRCMDSSEINDCLFPMLKKLFYFLLSFIPISIYYYNISILCLLLN